MFLSRTRKRNTHVYINVKSVQQSSFLSRRARARAPPFCSYRRPTLNRTAADRPAGSAVNVPFALSLTPCTSMSPPPLCPCTPMSTPLLLLSLSLSLSLSVRLCLLLPSHPLKLSLYVYVSPFSLSLFVRGAPKPRAVDINIYLPTHTDD